ncbi:MAG: hypothetical protein GX797_00450 [Chloroflexi bacterium]|jgi:DNA-binding NarL/FixJ family response regulator|nr:hypothetical protein [Chloroflexota bacterium]
MTQVFIFNASGALQILDFSARAEEIARQVNAGNWQTYVGYNQAREFAWQALRVGKVVILYPPPSPDDNPIVELRPRDLQILQALGSGLKMAQIAYNLQLSIKTVQNRLYKMMLKFNAKTREELIAKATALNHILPDLESIFD